MRPSSSAHASSTCSRSWRTTDAALSIASVSVIVWLALRPRREVLDRHAVLPDTPGGVPLLDHRVEVRLVLEGVHLGEETVVAVRVQPPLGHQALERLDYQLLALVHVVEDLVPQHEVAAVDPELGPADVLDRSHHVPIGR